MDIEQIVESWINGQKKQFREQVKEYSYIWFVADAEEYVDKETYVAMLEDILLGIHLEKR